MGLTPMPSDGLELLECERKSIDPSTVSQQGIHRESDADSNFLPWARRVSWQLSRSLGKPHLECLRFKLLFSGADKGSEDHQASRSTSFG